MPPISRLSLVTALCCAACLVAALPLRAEESVTEDSTARFQATYNWQRHPSFRSPYNGPNSIPGTAGTMYTTSATAFLGWRAWTDGELYFNPEMVQGVPFSGNLVGLGGFTNGEITRAAGTTPTFYRQRLFLRQTWNQGGGRETVEGDENQLAGTVDRDRVVLTAGNFSTLDVFDGNRYAKDPRTQFMNWGNWTYAAYDYAADARGFGWGFALEWYRQDWVLRLGRMSGPKLPNGLPVDLALARRYGDQLELEHAHEIAGEPGKLRLLAWRNRARLAGFTDSLAWLQAHPGAYTDPSALFAVRGSEKTKYGFGVNVEQSLGKDLGFFVRAMQADGRTETHAFTEVDGSLSTGLVVEGARWGRPEDAVGVAWLRNVLSRERRDFLAAGGISYFIGDGSLRYRPEDIVETYYSLGVGRGRWITTDLQWVRNPAYNADRGPIRVLAVRLHAEF